ncbi:hypothetical protein OMW55_07235 [Sphingomonas sp. BN140010]|uniref:N-acetyltransferase domain-containing protein n=1 Tax=Sphingomonas arvum TaxID=2992113 RepID=A0ABT3JEU8_9SPHN|nr:hypothetical protein [Sphingomonas sp. BN140010]MCW3797595.1 hypothetical protein [Sphingomonas sp. BN140010]
MKTSIVPMSTVPQELVEDYLTKPGIGRGFSPDELRWKYYDSEFNNGRERGFAWLKQGRVQGFIGVIPVTVATGDAGDRDLVWTCDWAVEDPANSPGIGILLLSKVHKNYDFVGGVGGTEYTRSIVPRMRTRTIPDAAVALRRPLRLKPLLERIERAASFAPKLSRTRLGQLTLPLRKTADPEVPVTMSTGVSAPVAALFDRPEAGVAVVRYDARHLAWIGRCPSLDVRSCHVGSGSAAAGALLWRRHDNPDKWRLSVRSTAEGKHLLEPLLADILARLRNQEAATVLATVVSGNDVPTLELLKRGGFITGEAHDLYITLLEGPGACEQGFAEMSYLDTDLGLVP